MYDKRDIQEQIKIGTKKSPRTCSCKGWMISPLMTIFSNRVKEPSYKSKNKHKLGKTKDIR